MSNKAIICRCEDVTLADLQHTISLGYKSIEEVKRYTGLGTGPCVGKMSSPAPRFTRLLRARRSRAAPAAPVGAR